MKPELIVALDVEKLEDAERLVKILYPTVRLFKVGSQLFTAYGRQAIEAVGHVGARVFLDLKFHDIPNTVYHTVISGTSSAIAILSGPGGVNVEDRVKGAVCYPVFMMTVHTQGGEEMMRAAARAAAERAAALKIERPLIVGVTVLTSDAAAGDTHATVLDRVRRAKASGLDGVVCSAQEAALVRRECGKDFIIVTPGIRPSGTAVEDQKRVATPSEAKEAGSDFIVVGRPIVESDDPLAAAKQILRELSE